MHFAHLARRKDLTGRTRPGLPGEYGTAGPSRVRPGDRRVALRRRRESRRRGVRTRSGGRRRTARRGRRRPRGDLCGRRRRPAGLPGRTRSLSGLDRDVDALPARAVLRRPADRPRQPGASAEPAGRGLSRGGGQWRAGRRRAGAGRRRGRPGRPPGRRDRRGEIGLGHPALRLRPADGRGGRRVAGGLLRRRDVRPGRSASSRGAGSTPGRVGGSGGGVAGPPHEPVGGRHRPGRAPVWIEGLPSSRDAASVLLDELAR